MFLYWDGYEIDGSDTDFDIILPENVQIREFIERFLSIPIFCKKTKPIYNTLPARSFHRGYVPPEEIISKSDFDVRLLSGDYSSLSIMVCCRHPEELDTELRSQIFSLSEGRKPHEEAYKKAENPCTPPANKEPFMTVDLTIGKVQKNWKKSDLIYEGSENAYSYNFSMSSLAKKGGVCFTLGIPVSSNYEYAMYIVKYMESYFPSIKVWGGIECSCGCTFGNSLYAYEKVQIPIHNNVKTLLKRLTEYGIIRSNVSFYNEDWTIEHSKSGFFLKAREDNWHSPPKEALPFEEYLTLIDLTLSTKTEPFKQIFETAVSMQLPPPDFYSENPQVVKILSEKLEAAVPYEIRKTWYKQDFLYLGYIAFVMIDDKPVCEFRVHYQMKNYLLALFELTESGMLDFIKAGI